MSHAEEAEGAEELRSFPPLPLLPPRETRLFWFFVDLVAGEPSKGAPTLFGPSSSAAPKPVERFAVSGWTSGVERRVGGMVRTQ
jgi:hypothetical protein